MRTLKTTAAATFILLLIVVAFGLGYYRGYLNSSRQHAGLHLEVDESLYAKLNQGALSQKDAEQLSGRLLVPVIAGEADTFHLMDKSPMTYFLYERVNARSGDMSEALKRADEITAKEYPPTNSASAIH